MEKTSAENQNYSEAKSAQLADNLIRQSQASALAAETIDKARKSARANPRQVGNVRKSLDGGFGYLNDPKEDTGHPTTDKQYRNDAYKDKVLGPVGLNKSSQEARGRSADIQKSKALAARSSLYPRSLVRAKLPAPLAQAQKVIAQIKVTQINMAAFAWVGYLWLAVQLPFAILLLIALGVVSAVDNLTAGEGGFFAWAAGKVVKAAAAVASLIGVDLASIAFPIYLLSQTIILALGIISVLALYLQYKLGGLKPFFGNGAGFKIGVLILVFVGYSMPILNLIPFVFLWMAAVWLYPR